MRRKDREITEIGEILKIADRAKILHLGLFDGEYPYVVPLHYGYEYTGGKLVFYMHSAKEGHKLDLIGDGAQVCAELDCDAELVSGGDVPCRYGSYFASVIVRGRAEPVTEEQEKCRALAILMKHQTGRDFSFTPEMAAAVAVIRVVSENFTAKSRPKA